MRNWGDGRASSAGRLVVGFSAWDAAWVESGLRSRGDVTRPTENFGSSKIGLRVGFGETI